MTPASWQHASREAEYGSEAEKLVGEKNARTLLAVVAGARDPAWAEALATAEGNRDNRRKEVIGAAYQRASDLRKTGATPTEQGEPVE